MRLVSYLWSICSEYSTPEDAVVGVESCIVFEQACVLCVRLNLIETVKYAKKIVHTIK